MTSESVDDARRAILDATDPMQPIDLPLAEAYGCVAAAEVSTEYDIPPFSSSEVDGFAARSADIVAAGADSPVRLRISGWALAGRPPEVTVGWGEAVRISAGAAVPAGADCIVQGDWAAVEGEEVLISEPVKAEAHIIPAGSDLASGSVLVPAGRRLGAAELGIVATAGYGSVLAYPKLRVGVISLGDLIEPGREAAFGQARDASSYLLIGALREVGASPHRVGIVTDIDKDLPDTVSSNALRVDAFVLAGGDSGSTETVASALSLGEIHSRSVALYPGGEIGHGVAEGKPFFHLAGDPAAAFVSFDVFVRPAVLKMMGRQERGRPELKAILDAPVRGPAGMTLYVPADISFRDGAWHCSPIGTAGEGHLGSYVRATGLLVVPPGDTEVAEGTEVNVQVLRAPER
ncbi:MAG: molybdopterin molybdotransferase MoeA [Actinomycetota bacterium]